MKYFICTYVLFVTSFVGLSQLSEDQKAVLKHSEDKEVFSEKSKTEEEQKESYAVIVENSIAHLFEVHQSVRELFHGLENQTQAKELLTNYTEKLNHMIPSFSTASILKFDVQGFHKWLLENKDQSEVIPLVLELFAVVESDLFRMHNT